MFVFEHLHFIIWEILPNMAQMLRWQTVADGGHLIFVSVNSTDEGAGLDRNIWNLF